MDSRKVQIRSKQIPYTEYGHATIPSVRASSISDPSELGKPVMEPVLRLATEGDLTETFRIYLRANQDFNRRLGRQVDLESHSLPDRAMAVRRNALRHDAERFWVAEMAGSTGAFGLAIRRRSFWYLAALHVLPEFQGRGLGTKLLRRCLDGPGNNNDAPNALLAISESANLVSTALYARFGLLPQTPILQLQGSPGPSIRQSHVELRAADPESARGTFDTMDKLILGEERPEDHECWSTVPSLIPYLIYEFDRIVGYIYVDRQGALGPAAVERPELLLPALEGALSVPDLQSLTQVRMRLPAEARESASALLRAGFEFDTGINLFLSSRQFGRMDCYLFSGADALF
jgi:GNAT superfamily N-acetyltransferase